MKKPPNMSMNRSLGFVAKIRLSPADVMSCIDCVDAVRGEMKGMSLSAVIKRGVAVALQTLRSNKVIPERDGYEYSAMIAPYNYLTKVEKIAAGHKMVMEDQQAQIHDMQPPSVPLSRQAVVTTPIEERLTRQKGEMMLKKNADPLNWDKDDEAKLRMVTAELKKIQQGGQ